MHQSGPLPTLSSGTTMGFPPPNCFGATMGFPHPRSLGAPRGFSPTPKIGALRGSLPLRVLDHQEVSLPLRELQRQEVSLPLRVVYHHWQEVSLSLNMVESILHSAVTQHHPLSLEAMVLLSLPQNKHPTFQSPIQWSTM